MYPGMDYTKLAANAVGPTAQFTQGIDPDWAQLATAYGYIQNPFPAAGTEGQDAMRYMATMKNIMDAQLGGPGGRYAQMSPNNPIAAMPFGMRQWFAGAAPLFQSVQGRMLMPQGQADMFGGGYQFGGLDTSQASAFMNLLASARNGQPMGAANTAQTPALPAPASSESQAAAEQVSGGNDTTNNPPPESSGTPSAANTEQAVTGGSSDIANALATLDQERTAAQQNSGNTAKDAMIINIQKKYPNVPPVIAQGVANGVLPNWLLDIVNGMGQSATNAVAAGQANKG